MYVSTYFIATLNMYFFYCWINCITISFRYTYIQTLIKMYVHIVINNIYKIGVLNNASNKQYIVFIVIICK